MLSFSHVLVIDLGKAACMVPYGVAPRRAALTHKNPIDNGPAS